MRHNIHLTGLLLAAIGIMLATCDKKEGETIDPLVGIYTFVDSSAILNEAVSLKFQGLDVIIPAGSDASLFITEGLLGSAPCDDPDNAAVELRNDGKAFYVCQTEVNEQQMGTWLINTDRTVLDLNISYPQAFQLKISDLTIESGSFSGTVENFPLPVDTSIELGDPLPGGGVNYQTASVSLTFTKVQ